MHQPVTTNVANVQIIISIICHSSTNIAPLQPYPLQNLQCAPLESELRASYLLSSVSFDGLRENCVEAPSAPGLDYRATDYGSR